MALLSSKSKVSPAFSVPPQLGTTFTSYTFNHNLGRLPHTVLARRRDINRTLDLWQDTGGTVLGGRVDSSQPNSCTVVVFRVDSITVDCELVIVG